MKIAPKIAAAAVAALALGGAGAATALAAGHSGGTATSVASAEPTSPDHDSVQQGDQTSPDASPAAATAGTSSPRPEADGDFGEQAAGAGGHRVDHAVVAAAPPHHLAVGGDAAHVRRAAAQDRPLVHQLVGGHVEHRDGTLAPVGDVEVLPVPADQQ